MSHYTILRDKKHKGRFFSAYQSHFTDVLVSDGRVSHGPITIPSNIKQRWVGSDQTRFRTKAAYLHSKHISYFVF